MKFLLGIIAIGLVAGVGIFHACKKNDKQAEPANKITKSGALLVNPFDQYGKWHNECLDYMFSQPNAANLTIDELWTMYGVEYFKRVLGDNYKPIPLSVLHANYKKTYDIVVNKQYLQLLDALVADGRINPNYTSPYIGRNNYVILQDYFTFLTNFMVTTEEDYKVSHEKLCDIEQEILSNYYSLLESGELNDYPPVKEEYEEVLRCMAIACYSSVFWYDWGRNWYFPDRLAYAKHIDFVAWVITGGDLGDRMMESSWSSAMARN